MLNEDLESMIRDKLGSKRIGLHHDYGGVRKKTSPLEVELHDGLGKI